MTVKTSAGTERNEINTVCRPRGGASVEIIKNLLVDYSIKVFTNDTKFADGAILQRR